MDQIVIGVLLLVGGLVIGAVGGVIWGRKHPAAAAKVDAIVGAAEQTIKKAGG